MGFLSSANRRYRYYDKYLAVCQAPFGKHGSQGLDPCYHQAMPKRPRRPRDPNELAFQVFQEAIGEAPPPPPEREKNAAAVALGRLGGAKGGAARAAKMTPEQRSESARKAAAARWQAKVDRSNE